MKTFAKVFKFRLKPNKTQRKKIAQNSGSARFTYNYALERFIKSAAEKIYLSYEDITKELTGLKRDPQTQWLKDAPAQILQQSVKDAMLAMDRFFKGKKKNKKDGFPKFRKKFVSDSFRYPQHISTNCNYVWLPKVGWVKFIKSREIEGTIKQAVVKREGNHWNISLACEIQQEVVPVKPKEERVVGMTSVYSDSRLSRVVMRYIILVI